MGIMNLRLARKAYLFEFIDKGGKNEYFSFAVPPEMEDFDFPQRITETKTLGGSVFDDYGSDTISIQISGTTINEERKLIYRGKDGKFIPRYLSGEKEIFELQKLISKWGEGDKIPGKKIYLYDLSKMSLLQIAGGVGGTPSRNYWRVVIKKFKIKRSKEKPNTYNYSLDMTGMEDTDRSLPSFFSGGIANALNKCQECLEKLETFLEATEAVGDALDTAMSAITKTKEASENLLKGNGPQVVDNILGAPLRLITGGSDVSLYNFTRSLISSGNKLSNLVNGEDAETRGSGVSSRDDEFTVSYNSNGGSFVKSEKVAYSKTATKPDNPAKSKYAFAAWCADEELTEEFDFATEITANIILYAKWEQTTATVTFNSRGGAAVPAQSVTIGETAQKPEPDPARGGFAFEYWCADAEGENEFDFDTPVTGDLTLYARWKVVYTVVFNSNGGGAVESQIIDVGGKVIYPRIPARENYLFSLWCADPLLSNEYDFSSTVTSGFTLYAKWTRVSNNVGFDSNGGSAVPEQTVPIGGHAERPADPVREGYTFIRWCADATLTQEFLFSSMPINYPTVIYAAWEINVLAVSFDSGGGTEIEEQHIGYGGLAVYPPTPEKEGALFARWCRDAELTEEYDFSTPVREDTVLYAQWHGEGGEE